MFLNPLFLLGTLAAGVPLVIHLMHKRHSSVVPWPTLRFLGGLFRSSRVVGCDVVELAPIPGLHHADFTVARLVHKLVGMGCGSSFRAPEEDAQG